MFNFELNYVAKDSLKAKLQQFLNYRVEDDQIDFVIDNFLHEDTQLIDYHLLMEKLQFYVYPVEVDRERTFFNDIEKIQH
jgi:hypothetical protein